MIRFFNSATEARDVIEEAVWQQGPAVLDPLLLMHDGENDDAGVAEGQAILVTVNRLSADEHASVAGRRAG